ADRNRSHWSTSKTPSYTKSVSWQHHPFSLYFAIAFSSLDFLFLFTNVIVTGFMNFLQLNPAQNLFHTA
ncbi:hypothetical protein, partial [Escherichia coli]|uniref:hypothetical protein n=1 Tax=Escherichia coli TaxID=562 RepID=UPI001FF3F2A3